MFRSNFFNNSFSINYKLDEWSRLITEIPEQSIGLWMLPNINNLRVAINVCVSAPPESC